MTWMLTTSGGVVDLRRLDLDGVGIWDIAHSLARQCRFTGHTARHYSVAEHSLHVASIVEHDLGQRAPGVILAALLHDAHEALTGDLSTPMKQLIGTAWDIEERRIQRAVLTRWGAWQYHCDYAAVIKRADLIALAVERRDLMPPMGPAWPSLHGVPTSDYVLSLHDYVGMDTADWRDAFVDKFHELTYPAAGGASAVCGC